MPGKVADMLAVWNENPPFKGFATEKAALLLSIISTHQRKDDNGNIYCQLKMEYLRNIIWHAEDYIQLFIKTGVIRRIPGFVPKKQAYRYQFTPAFQSPYITHKLENPKLLRKIREADTKKGRIETRFYPKQKQQLKTMTINYDAAIELAKKEFPDNIIKCNFAIGQATRIQNKEFYLVKDESGHRVHTPLSNLVKSLRSEIQIEGQYLSGLDIANSQLYFSIKFLLDPESVKDFFPSQFPLMMAKSLRLSQQQDVIRFVLLVTKAQFYKFMETEFLKAGLIYGDNLKRKIFTILFEKNHLTSKAKRIFQKHFPNVDKAFSILRMVNYTDFVNCLTRLESFAVNDLIIARLNKEYPEMVAQQIYDNLVTSIVTNDIKTASKVMTEELIRFVGFAPVLRIENFRPTTPFDSNLTLNNSKVREGREGVPYDGGNLVIN